jgi:hypothetical protein
MHIVNRNLYEPVSVLVNIPLYTCVYTSASRNTSAGIPAGTRFPEGATDFPLFCSFQPGPGVHLASYHRGLRRPGYEADSSPQSSAEVKNGGAIPTLSHTSSWVCVSLMKHGETLSLSLP